MQKEGSRFISVTLARDGDICYNCHIGQQMTRIDVSEAMWRRFRSLAVERGLTTPELLGSVVGGYVRRAEKRRRVVRVEGS
jgi:hypothetical protein